MKITFVLPTVSMSGGIRVVAIYAQWLARQGHQVFLISQPPAAPSFKQKVKRVLQGQGLGLQHLVRCTVMLADMADWAAFNEVWRDAFGDIPLPARSAFGCQGLALSARVEIECIAVSAAS